MITGSAYTTPLFTRRMHLHHVLALTFSIYMLFVISQPAYAQEQQEYDEILVYMEIPRIGGFEVPAVISGNELYLAVTDLFDFLKVRNIASPDLDSVSGFFVNHEATYIISYPASRIRFQDRIYTISKGDLIRTESNLYLKSSYFGRIFGLECSFNFRSLSVTITSKLELPVIREMRLEEMRKNLTRLRGEIKADTSLGRTHPLFRLGMADWSVVASEEVNGRTDATINVLLGGMLAGGEATASIYYNSRDPFTEKQQNYLWRYADNDFKPLRQISAGKINSQAVSTLYNPVIGVQLTNTPTTFRRSFGTYKLSDRTEPGWIVELYVNNVLVDYAKADASGFFSFDVPLVYGNSSVRLKFFGPWGEERIREQNINIPYNFLPAKTFEYNVGAGIVEDSLMSRFSRGSVSYGLSRSITVGGGVEYLSSVRSGPAMPFINSSFRITNNLLLSGDYTFGVRAKGSMVLRLPSNIQMDLSYIWYEKGQTAINYNYREERKLALSLPLHLGKLSTYQRFTVNQIILPASQFTAGEWLFSGTLFGINTNLTTYALFHQNTDPYIYSSLSLAVRLPAQFTFMPQVQYSYTQNYLISARLRLEKLIGSHAFLNLQYEKYFRSNLNLAEIGFRYDFSFAQAGFTMRQANSRTRFIQYARGSFIADTKTGYFRADNRPNVGKGGITVIAYLDINSNGGRDPGEPRATGLNIHANGGRIIRNEKDTTIRILGLEPYTSYLIELDPDGFESISWQLPVKTLSVVVDPEILKIVEIPVSVAGEASGMITTEKEGKISGLARIRLSFYNESNKLIGSTLSEDDGYYNYFGLASGEYYVQPDSVQMSRLAMQALPILRRFSIAAGKEGDIVSDLDFTVMKIKPDTVTPQIEKPVVKPQQPVVKKDTTYMIVHEVTRELVTISEDSYAVQLGAFRKRSNAETYRKTLENILGRKVEIVIENNLYKVRVTGLKNRDEVNGTVAALQKNGVSEVWIVTLKARQQQWILVEKTDSVLKVKDDLIKRAGLEDATAISIQVGAFRKERNAVEQRQRISALIGKPVVIVQEGGYFKVRITGFRDMNELNSMLPLLDKLGIKDIWVPFMREETEIQPVEIKPPDKQPVIEKPADSLIVRKDSLGKAIKPESDTARLKQEDKLVEKPAEEEKPEVIEKPEVKVPPVSLHVGEFRKRAQALRAQRKVSSKFGMEVEILMRWDTYHLVITGFWTREDTFRFYPELAGMGYTNIYVIERK